MTRDEIIRMAREAAEKTGTLIPAEWNEPILEHFAALVSAAEREACAKACDAQATEWDSDNVQLYKNYAGACSEAIRARGEKGQQP